MRGQILVAALVACKSAQAALDPAWASQLAVSIQNQVESQAQASIAAAVPGIVSNSANAIINSQLGQFTTNQPAAVATTQAAQPAATQAATQAQPVQVQQTTADNSAATTQAPATTTAVKGATTLSTQILPGAVTKPSGQQELSNLPDVTTLPNGSVVTISGTLTTMPLHVNTATVENSDFSGTTTIHTTTRLSRTASIGLGVGLGLFLLLFIVAFLAFRWWSKRRQAKQRQHSRTPSLVISAPLEPSMTHPKPGERFYAKQASEVDGSARSELDHTPSTSTRSPVSPWTPGTTGSQSLAPPPVNIFELMGSGPVEMPAESAANEMIGSPVEEDKKDEGMDEKKERPSSIQKTPEDAFFRGNRELGNV